MKRRDFARYMTKAVCGGTLVIVAPTYAFSQSTRLKFKVGNPGQLLASPDGGLTWALHTNFGEAIDILDIHQTDQATALQLQFSGHRFRLKTTHEQRQFMVS